MIGKFEYRGITGDTYIFDRRLRFLGLLKVTREDKVYRQVTGTPGNMEFRYVNHTGRLEFNNPFAGSITGDRSMLEKVKVIWQL